VRPGDSLGAIAKRQGVSPAQLRQANGLTGDRIKPGQKLVIPGS
jgi:membrane-bound lytic murein transglycosylase D